MSLKHLTFHTVFFLQFHAIFIAKDIMSENNAQKMLSVIENNFPWLSISFLKKLETHDLSLNEYSYRIGQKIQEKLNKVLNENSGFLKLK